MTWASGPTSFTYCSRLGPEVVEPSLPAHWASEVAGQAAQNAIATAPQNIALRIARPSLMPRQPKAPNESTQLRTEPACLRAQLDVSSLGGYVWSMRTPSTVHKSHPTIVRRLKRVVGHLRSVVAMMEEKRPCVDIAQ